MLGLSAVNFPLLILYWVIQAPRIEADIWHLCSTGCTSAPQAGTISSLLSRLPMKLQSCFMIIPLVWNQSSCSCSLECTACSDLQGTGEPVSQKLC